MLEPFPNKDDFVSDKNAVEQIQWIKTFLMVVRRIRAERDIAPGKPLNVFVRNGTDKETGWLSRHQTFIKSLARIESINKANSKLEDTVMAFAGEMVLLVPLADIIDPVEESRRLKVKIEKLEKEKTGMENKLANKNFIERAPENVVEGAKQRFTDTLNEINTYQEQLKSIYKLLNSETSDDQS